MPVPRDTSTGSVRHRSVATLLIVVSVGLQLVVTTRLVCPPQSLTSLRWLRVGCAPRLWPFTDYPMFSAPHARGETLAWIDARTAAENGTLLFSSALEVQRESAAETWDEAFQREEDRLRAELQPELAARHLPLVFERHRLVLTADGLVPPCDDCPEPQR